MKIRLPVSTSQGLTSWSLETSQKSKSPYCHPLASFLVVCPLKRNDLLFVTIRPENSFSRGSVFLGFSKVLPNPSGIWLFWALSKSRLVSSKRSFRINTQSLSKSGTYQRKLFKLDHPQHFEISKQGLVSISNFGNVLSRRVLLFDLNIYSMRERYKTLNFQSRSKYNWYQSVMLRLFKKIRSWSGNLNLE